MLAGVVVSTRLGVQATVFYLGALPGDEHRGVRGDRGARARDATPGDDISSLYGLGADAPGAGVADDDRDALAGRLPRHGRVLRQALPDRGGGRQRVRVARRRDRARLGDLARLLPAGRRGGLDALAVRGGASASGSAPRRRGRSSRAGRRRPTSRGAARASRSTRARRGPPRRSPPPSRRAACGPASRRSSFVTLCARSPRSRSGIYPDPLLDLARDAGAALTSLV